MTGDRVMRPVLTGPWRSARAGLRRRGLAVRLRHGAPHGSVQSGRRAEPGQRIRRTGGGDPGAVLHLASTDPAALAAQIYSLQRSYSLPRWLHTAASLLRWLQRSYSLRRWLHTAASGAERPRRRLSPRRLLAS